MKNSHDETSTGANVKSNEYTTTNPKFTTDFKNSHESVEVDEKVSEEEHDHEVIYEDEGSGFTFENTRSTSSEDLDTITTYRSTNLDTTTLPPTTTTTTTTKRPKPILVEASGGEF